MRGAAGRGCNWEGCQSELGQDAGREEVKLDFGLGKKVQFLD
jgi:hypothetical protein